MAIECAESLCVPAEWYDEETIRGDVLRQFRELENKPDIGLELEAFLPEGVVAGSYAHLVQATAADRGGLLLAASKLGVDLLGLDDEE